jgi:hypothetical protein
MWPGEEHPWDNTVYIQLKRWRDPNISTTVPDAQKRREYWASFQTLIHEYIHACAHANFARSSGSGQQNQVLIEGGDDWLVTKLWADLKPKLPSDNSLREQVEGKPYAFNATVIPPLNRYDEWQDVDSIVKKLGPNGEANFLSAYFLGHVEYLGLGNWSPTLGSLTNTFEVLVDDFPVALVAERTFVPESTIRNANGLGPSDKLKKGRINVPGISYHICVKYDNLSSIAKQHGITELALQKANPYVTDWNKLSNGSEILIPKH